MEVSDCNEEVLVCLMISMVVANEGAVKCQGGRVSHYVAGLLCLRLLVQTDQEFDEVL